MSESLSTLEYENLEQKNIELRRKLKRSQNNNDKATQEIKKLVKKNRQLESENHELRSQNDNLRSQNRQIDSEVSSSSASHHHQDQSDLAELIHTKNQQISDLLKDIEELENDNVALREKLTDVKEQLATATREISSVTETIKAKELQLQEEKESIARLNATIESLQDELLHLKNEKAQADKDLETFAVEIDKKIEEWKQLLESKNREIAQLKKSRDSRPHQSGDDQINEDYLEALKRALVETEAPLEALKEEMQHCTKELSDSARVIDDLKNEKVQAQNQVKNLADSQQEMKKLLQGAQERCRGLQEEVECANKMAKLFEGSLADMKNELKERGEIDTAKILARIQTVQVKNLLLEKQIAGLIRDINKVQENCNRFEIENAFLRNELGVRIDDVIDIDPAFLTESKKLEQHVDKYKVELRRAEQEKIDLRMEVKNLNRKVKQVQQQQDNKDDLKALSEENEALRKGLHEILNSVQAKTGKTLSEISPRVIKSEVLENLLKALDAKHISGWYHSAMRLQAELHSLEGINRELREQLYDARADLDKYKSTQTQQETLTQDESKNEPFEEGVVANFLKKDFKTLQEIRCNFLQLVVHYEENSLNPKDSLDKEFSSLHNNLQALHENCQAKQKEEKPHDLDENIAKLKQENDSINQKRFSEAEAMLQKMLWLQRKLNVTETVAWSGVGADLFAVSQKTLHEQVAKYRKLLVDFEELKNYKKEDMEILQQQHQDIVKENYELKDKIQTLQTTKEDPNCAPLSSKLAAVQMEALAEKQRADHTNNLYELVKEQLRKSEQKFVEFSKYGETLLQKNLSLQERVAELEDKVGCLVDHKLYEELCDNLKSLIRDKDELVRQNTLLKEQLSENVLEQKSTSWDDQKEQELLDLRHQIVDLTTNCQEKLLISQLHVELSKCKSNARDNDLKIQFLRNEVGTWEKRYTLLTSKVEEDRRHFDTERARSDKRISLLQECLLKLRLQYYGSVPVMGQEILVQKLKELSKEKHEAFTKRRDFSDTNEQVKYLLHKIEHQNKLVDSLEQQLLQAFGESSSENTTKKEKRRVLVPQIVSQESIEPTKKVEAQLKLLRNVFTQTHNDDDNNERVKNLEVSIGEANQKMIEKDREIVHLKRQVSETKAQLVALERKWKEMQNEGRLAEREKDRGGAGDGVGLRGPGNLLEEQMVALKATLESTQAKLAQKQAEIGKYQTLLKDDRDRHSLASANLQQELAVLRKALAMEQQRTQSLEEGAQVFRQKSVAVEKYVTQVRALERHLADLHTQQAKLEAQLVAAQQEAARWRQMAQDRLVAMQELGKSLNEQHRQELDKRGSGEEAPTKLIDPDVLNLCREKDEKIRQLTNRVLELEHGELGKAPPSSAALAKDLEQLKKRYETLANKERSAQGEIKDLKEQLSKRSNLSARSHKSEKSVKEQLQKKIALLEAQIDELNDKLAHQALINEKHKLSADADFDKWKKQKFWQEQSEKHKAKLQEREEELEKLHQTCTGYRMLIERLEREKINLENRNKALVTEKRGAVSVEEVAFVKSENTRLAYELAVAQTKLEVRQQGAGALGAALMQEKLEAQERKIAVLELSAKGTIEVRNELERLQTTVSTLQKANLCLEAENLELKMDLEKCSKETPHLQEQIQHLENYIEVLKNEKNQNQTVETSSENADDKKVSQLERTVFILKRVVEKLQVENKRLLNGNKRPATEKSSSADKLKRDYLRLKEQHTECLQKIKELETANKKLTQKPHATGADAAKQLTDVKEQLAQKSQLLDKVKTLLHGAAAREKQLLAEIANLKAEKDIVEMPSTIEEVSEDNFSDT